MPVGFYDMVRKFNPNHDKKGRFSSSGGSAYEIKSETTDYTGNELYARSAAYKDGKEVGYVEYSKPDGMPPYVQYIHVNEDQRGNGIARKLLQDLQRQYPNEEIDFGYTTADGTELLKRVLKPVVDKDLKAKFDSLEDKRKQLEQEEKAMDELFEKIGDRDATAQERKILSNHGDKWEVLDGEIRQLSEELRGKKHTKMMVDMTDGVNKSFFTVLQKFNPNHDKLGRFAASGSGGTGREKGTTYKLYHGSPNANISRFDISHSGENTQSGENLLFFTDSREFADSFSYERLPGTTMVTNRKGEKGRVYEVDVTMKKPLDLRNLSDTDVDNIIKLSDDDTLTADEVRRLAGRNHQLLKTYIDLQSGALKELGYDGLIADTMRGALEYAVVSNDQVKITKMVSKTFTEVIRKYNSIHDHLGRFASGHGATLQADKGTNAVSGKNDVKNPLDSTDVPDTIKVGIKDLKNGLKISAEPNSVYDKVNVDNRVLQRRYYDKDGKASVDIDTSDHNDPDNHPKNGHKHRFDHSRKTPRLRWEPLTIDDRRRNRDIVPEKDD